MNKDAPQDYKSERRLQRSATNTQPLVSTFYQVLTRHGLTMGTIAGACLFVPISFVSSSSNFASIMSSPFYYLATLSAMLLTFIFTLSVRGHKIERTLVAWLAYLFFISVVEEFAFRLILPIFLSDTLEVTTAVFVSNLLFACIHYVTLRWKVINCAIVFMAGLGLSRLLANTEDMGLVILIHFFFTFFNTPTPPKQRQ